MKKIFALLLTLIMCVSASVTVFAANAGIAVTSEKAERNEIVYLTVSLENCEDADTLAISMEYDSTVLKKLAGRSEWLKEGALGNFDATKDHGVWKAEEASDLNGNVCKLAFQVKVDAPIGKTDVKCTVIVQNDTEVIGTYTATGTVEVTCEHVGEGWTKVDDTYHGYNCVYCDTLVKESHTWDDGVVTTEPTETSKGEKTYTCSVCKGTKVERLPEKEPSGDEPGGNEGNQGGTDTPGGNEGNQGGTETPGGNEGNQDSTETPGGNEGNQGGTETPGGNEGNQDSTETPGGNEGNQGGTETPGGDEGNQDSTETPGGDEGNQDSTQKPDDDKTPVDGDKDPGISVGAIVTVLLIIGAIAGAAYYFIKKK